MRKKTILAVFGVFVSVGPDGRFRGRPIQSCGEKGDLYFGHVSYVDAGEGAPMYPWFSAWERKRPRTPS